MSHQIDPLILKKLEAFARRRRKLIIFRGVCAALATLLLTMMIIALIDRLFRLPDAARWALSLTAYAAVIFVEWRSCLRLLMHAPGPRRLARLVEHAEPKLREDLLSAVELGDARSDAAFDSEEFRALVQTDVAHRMEGMNVERLLPVNLVRRYIGIAAVILAGCVVAFALSGGQFGTLLLRALAPGANLDRVSRVKVKVIEPASPDMIVPQGETIPLVIELGGQRANTAEVEMLTVSGAERVKMTAIGPDRFSASIQVGRDDVLYRIYAGDAVTKKYRLHAVARPHVVKFDKTFRFPAYTRMEPKQASEENGDLAALEGTEVELRLQTNQPIKDGELRVEQGKNSYVVKLAAEGGQLTGKVPLNASGTYRVQLVSSETGFENKFSPEYELRAEPDLIPQVELESPKQDLILASNDMVDLLGTAKDDQSLAKVVQLVKVNDGKWKETVLVETPGPVAAVERRWDLYEQGVKPGDLITTKLVAIDMKGSRGESRPLQITITKSGFETSRIEALDAQRALHETLKALRAAGDALEKSSNETREQFERLPDGDAQRRTVAMSAGALGETFAQQFAAAWTQLLATLKAAEPGHATADIAQVGRLLSRIDASHLQIAKDAQGIVAANPDSPMARELMREWAEGNGRAAQRARFAEETFRPLLYSGTLQVIAENVQVVAREQARLAALAEKTGNDKAKWAQLANRVRVVLSEARAMESLLNAGAQTGGGDRLKQAAKRIEKERTAVERALAAGEPSGELDEPIQKLSRVTAETVRAGFEMVRDQSYQATEAHTKITREVQPTYSTFEKLRQELQQWNAADKLPVEIRAAIGSRRIELRGLSLKQHGDIEETRRDADSEFVNDTRTATRALEGIRIKSAEAGREKTDAQIVALDKDFRLLENAHNLAEGLTGLNQLVIAERWEITSSQARTVNLRDWRWLEFRMRALPDELSKIQSEAPLRELVQQAQRLLWEAQKLPEWKSVIEEMNRRGDPEREPETASREVAQVAAQVKLALELLRQPIGEARARLVEMAPKLSEIAEQLAKETKELKKETEEQAQKAAEKKPEEAQADSQKALAQQQNLNERVEALKDAVRAEANRQDILSKEGREAARDADDALALLKEPPPKAESALSDAAQAQLPSAKAEAMTEAAKEQQKLSDALDLLAKHFENVEQGKPEETRLALRATEEMTGIKAAMDAQAARAEQLAQMAQKTPEELLKQLEAALPQNPTMQKELSQIAQNTLSNAQEKLADAARTETDVAQLVTEMAAQPKDAAPRNLKEAAANAKQAAREAAQAAQASREAANQAVQKAKQANNEAAADQARGAREESESAKQSADRAVQATDRMNDEKQMAEAAQEAAQSAADAAQDAKEAAEAAQQSQTTAQQTANKESGQQQAKNQEAAKESAQAQQAAQKAEQAAKKAEMAARQLAAMAQQAGEQKEQMARNEAAMQGAREQASAKAKQAAEEAVAAAQAAHEAANEAVQTAKHADNQTAADQARAARAEAQNAMQAAERGVQAAEQIADPKQAAQAGQKAAQMASEAAGNAQKAAQSAQQSQATAQQSAAKESGEQQAKNQAASKEAGEAIQAAQKAAQAAKKAETAAMEAAAVAQQSGGKNSQMAQNAASGQQGQQAQNASQQNNPMLAQAAQQQQQIAQNAAQAGAEVERAGRHEERLMNAPAGQQLQQLGAEISETAMSDVPAAEKALGQAQQAAQAQQAVNAANNELRRELGQLEAAASQPSASQTAPASAQSPQAQSATPQQASAQQAGSQSASAQSGEAQPASAQAAQPGSQPGSQSAPTSGQPGAQAPSQAQAAAAPVSPQEQVWMARTLDALDAIMHSPPTGATPDAQGQQAGQSQSESGQQAQSAQGQQQQGAAQSQQGSQSAQAAAQSAQQAMASAAQAAAAAMRGARSETPGDTPGAPTSSSRSVVSKGGAKAESPSMARGALPDGNGKAGEWGKLPKQMAEQLTRGQSEAVAGEYRHQVETYYRVIAEKSKKP